MDPIAQEAITSITQSLTNLLPPNHGASLLVLPQRVRPVGLGGHVGEHPDPRGEIVIRRIDGSAEVTVSGDSPAELATRIAGVTGAYVGADPVELRRAGIFRLQVERIGDQTESGPGNNRTYARVLSFSLLAEHQHLPDEASDVIESMVHDLLLPGGAPLRTLYERRFEADPLLDFEVIDDPNAGTQAPSAWAFDAAGQRITQSSAIRGGQNIFSANKPGTALVLRRHETADGVLLATCSCTGSGPMGVVFRWQSPTDFYFFLMDAAVGYRLLGRKVGGSFSFLDTGGQDDSAGYESARPYALRVGFEGSQIVVALDGSIVLRGEDRQLSGPGRVGLLVRNNTNASFHRLSLIGIGP